MVSLPSDFRASVDSYSGPLDLLLYLIKKDEVDIFDIPIAPIIGQYQLYLELLRDLDPNLCGEFLVMAANLMEIKSKLLLPREELAEEEDLEDPRMELVRQLLEYKKFKERALLLEKQLDSHRHRFQRPSATIPQAAEDLSEPLPVGNIDVWDLLTAFHRIQIALGQRVPVQVVLEDRPVGDYMNEIRSELEARADRTADFEELFIGARTREEAIGYFLAILELAKQYEIIVTQDEPGSSIEVTLRDEEETRRLQELDAQDVDSLEEETPEGETPADGAAPPVDVAEKHLLRGEGEEAVREEFDDEAATASAEERPGDEE